MNPSRLTFEQRAIVQAIRCADSLTIVTNKGKINEVVVSVDSNARFIHDVGLAMQTYFQYTNEYKK